MNIAPINFTSSNNAYKKDSQFLSESYQENSQYEFDDDFETPDNTFLDDDRDYYISSRNKIKQRNQKSQIKHEVLKYFKNAVIIMCTTAGAVFLIKQANPETMQQKSKQASVPHDGHDDIVHQNEDDIVALPGYGNLYISQELPPEDPAVVIIEDETNDIEDVDTENDSKAEKKKKTEEHKKEKKKINENYQYSEPNTIQGLKVELTQTQKKSLEELKDKWEENKKRYIDMEEKTGIPAKLICALHYRESEGNFNTCMHGGEKFGEDIKTGNQIKRFYSWEDSAYDALTNKGNYYPEVEKGDVISYLLFAEAYNGFGYRKLNIKSPYLWSGTNRYDRGKYTNNGFDPNLKDGQLGVYAMLCYGLGLDDPYNSTYVDN